MVSRLCSNVCGWGVGVVQGVSQSVSQCASSVFQCTSSVVCGLGVGVLQSVSQSVSQCTSSVRTRLRFSCLTRANLQVPLRIFVVTASTASIVASGILLKCEMQEEEERDPAALTAYSVNLGISVRMCVEGLFPSTVGTKMRDAQDALSRWAFETYETLFQIIINVPEDYEQPTLNVLLGVIGYHAAGDVITLSYSQITPLIKPLVDRCYRRPGYETLEDVNSINDVPPHSTDSEVQEEETPIHDLPPHPTIVSPLLQPACDKTERVILLSTIISVTGIAGVVFGYSNLVQRESLIPFVEAGGYFLGGQGGGYISMEALRYLERWLRKDIHDETTDSFQIKVLRKLFEFTPIVATEVISAISSKSVGMFTLVGWLYGMRNNEVQNRFQYLTPEVHQAKIEQNQTVNEHGQNVKKTAIKIDEYLSVAFFTVFTGWFGYGIYGAIPRDQVALSSFIVSTLGSAVVAKIADSRFWPGKNNRVLNQLNYMLFDNSLFSSVIYMLIKQMTAISNKAINQDTSVQLIFGDTGVILFGVMLGSGRIGKLRLVRGPFADTGSSFRILAIWTVIDSCNNTV